MKSIKKIKQDLLKKVKERTEIDPEILDVVIGLNAFNIPTQSSCAGHADKKWLCCPYVDIYADNQNINFEDYSPENAIIKEKWIIKNIFIQKTLIQLLEEFYSIKKPKFLYQITPHTMINWAGIRLKSIGADTLQIMNDTQRPKELIKFQNEMKRFGKFLQNKYKNSLTPPISPTL